jgi:GH15 family glucan-1,4-alpha-glucosidase
MDAIYTARRMGMDHEETIWDLQQLLLENLEGKWDRPDHGLWEVRGDPQHFTHSRLMSWVAFDRAVKCVEQWDFDGPADHWRELRGEIRAEIEDRGYDPDRNTFTQSYGSRALDAALLLLPQVGFLPPTDERVLGTIDAIERELSIDDCLIRRYDTGDTDDGLPGDEGAFLLCSFWMVDALALAGRRRSTTRSRSACWATTRRLSAISRSSTPPTTWPAKPQARPGIAPRIRESRHRRTGASRLAQPRRPRRADTTVG